MTLFDFAPSPTMSWTEVCAEHLPGTGALTDLSPAERVVAAHIRLGLSNREIARRLGKSECTIKNQVSACLRKLSLRSRAQLIVRLG